MPEEKPVHGFPMRKRKPKPNYKAVEERLGRVVDELSEPTENYKKEELLTLIARGRTLRGSVRPRSKPAGDFDVLCEDHLKCVGNVLKGMGELDPELAGHHKRIRDALDYACSKRQITESELVKVSSDIRALNAIAKNRDGLNDLPELMEIYLSACFPKGSDSPMRVVKALRMHLK